MLYFFSLYSYLSLLNILTLVLAYKTRKIPDNYNEAGFLFLASFLSSKRHCISGESSDLYRGGGGGVPVKSKLNS